MCGREVLLSICISGFLCFCLPNEEARKSSERESDSNIGGRGRGKWQGTEEKFLHFCGQSF